MSILRLVQERDSSGDAARLAAANAAIKARVEPFQSTAEGQDPPPQAAPQVPPTVPTPIPAAAPAQPGGGVVDAGALARILSGIAGGAVGGGAMAPPAGQPLSLSRVLDADRCAALLLAPEQSQGTRSDALLAELLGFLPEGQRSVAHARTTLRSPHFRQQLDAFTAALAQGQVDLRQFGLEGAGWGVDAFLEAVMRAADKADTDGGSGATQQ